MRIRNLTKFSIVAVQIAAAWVVLTCLGAAGNSPACAADRPNIIFFLADDLRNDQLGCAGHPVLKTPTIDHLAAGGTRFTHAFVTTSICAASRATLLTGLYERSHKYTFGTPGLAKKLTDQSYPALLREAGYRTGFVGKFGVKVQPDVTGQMFDYFKPLNRNPYFKTLPDGSKRHISEIAGDLAVNFLKQGPADQPFCLSVSFNAPHAEDSDKRDHYPWPKAMDGLYDDVTVAAPRLSEPEVFESQPDFLKQSLNRQRWFWRWDTPEKYQKNIKAYYRMVSGVDHVMGRVLAAVKKLDLADNTVVIFSGDNGYYLGARGFAGKWSHYEDSLRVPLIVYDPRSPQPQRGQLVDSMALNVDIPATILDMAGVRVPDAYQGRSLTPWLRGQKPGDWRQDFFCEHLMHYPGGLPKWEGVRGQRYVYARYFEQQPPYEFLHDLQTDPQQLKNFAGDPQYARTLASMRARCDELRDAYGGQYSEEKFPHATRRAARPQPNQKPAAKPTKPTASNTKRPPNVVLIISDDQAWNDYGFMGHDVIKTPRLDKLASQSATFTRGYVPTGLCRPSLATIITGLYPHQHGICGNDPALPAGAGGAYQRTPEYQKLRDRLIAHIDEVPTLPRLLGRQGYVSFQCGKWWEGNFRRGGFTEGMTHGDPKRGGRHGDLGLKIGREGMKDLFNFIDASQDKPFLVWYAPFLPHSPHNPPERILQKYVAADRPIELAKYYAMCEWFDETCGQLLDHLDQRGLSENTLVVYVCDNGWIQRTSQTQTPQGWKGSFAPRSKQSPNEGGVRTPIMFRWPGKIKPRRDDETLVSSIDIAPTVLAACGVKPPAPLPGVNLLGLCEDGKPLQRDTVYGEGFAHDVADVDDPSQSLLYRWVIDGRWKLLLKHHGKLGRYKSLHTFGDGKPELYDLKADPHETHDLASQEPDRVRRMTEQINNWWPVAKKKAAK